MGVFIDVVLRQLAPTARARDLTGRRRELQTLDREIANLTTAIAQGGHLPSLLAEMQTRQARRGDVAKSIDAQSVVNVSRIDRARIERKVHAVLGEWHPRRSGARPPNLARHVDRAAGGEDRTGAAIASKAKYCSAVYSKGKSALQLMWRAGPPSFLQSLRNFGALGGLPTVARLRNERAKVGAPGRSRTCDPRLRRPCV